MKLKAPFPWFGGKSRVAAQVWARFGDVANYVEPFAGSLAVLLGRPTRPRVETVNDLDCFVANFWRSMVHEPEAVAEAADWPVNEADLHARHRKLHAYVAELGGMAAWRKRFHDEPEHCLPWVAGWWAWGLSCWIGDNWCRVEPQAMHPDVAGHSAGKGLNALPESKRPVASGAHAGRGVHRKDGSGLDARRPSLTSANGVHQVKRPKLNGHTQGAGLHMGAHQMPCLHGDGGATGRGVNASGLVKRMPNLGTGSNPSAGLHAGALSHQIPMLSEPGRGLHQLERRAALLAWFLELQARLRAVRVCCGDFARVLGDSVTTCHGITGVFLDPPYSVEDRDKVYNADSLDVAPRARAWALANGARPDLRIALCGYAGLDGAAGEHDELEAAGWSVLAWKASGGYAARNKKNQNARRERIWFSPHCLQGSLFDGQTLQEATA